MPTRAEIRAEARQMADLDSSDFPTDDQMNIAINRGANRVFLDMYASGWPINHSTTTITANGSTLVHAFGGSDSVLGSTLVYTDIGGQRFELKRVNPGHTAVLRSTNSVGQFSEFYEVRLDINQGPVVEFFPRVAGTYYVDYLPGFAGFANDAAQWRGPYGTDELLALYAAAFGASKESRSTDAAAFRKLYDDRLFDLKRTASWFDARNPAMIRDAVPGPQLRNPFDHWAVGPNHFEF